MYLQKILQRRRCDGRYDHPPELDEMLSRAASLPAPRDFKAALTGDFPAIIAEFKRASPSKGVLNPDLNPERQARAYQAGGAAAISVLTDSDNFQGSLDDLTRVRRACRLPVLRKDFLLEPWEVAEARLAEADAVLLIVAALSEDRLAEMLELAHRLGMQALVEIHDEAELETAVRVKAPIIGINNRDLQTFKVDLGTSSRLAAQLPPDTLKVSESGLSTAADLKGLEGLVDAFLIGESLVKSPEPTALLRDLRSISTETKVDR